MKKITYQLQKHKLIQSNLGQLVENFRHGIVPAIVVITVIVLINLDEFKNYNWTWEAQSVPVLGTIGILAFVLGFTAYITYSQAAKDFKIMAEEGNLVQEVCLFPESFTLANKFGTDTFYWSPDVVNVRQDKHHIYFELRDRSHVAVPLTSFPNETDAQAFFKQATTHLEQAKAEPVKLS